MTAFDTAWGLTKFDFHFSERPAGGHHIPAKNITAPDMPDSYTANRYAHYESKWPMALWQEYDSNRFPRPSQTESGEKFHRGQSTPRLQDDGSYAGVNLSRQTKKGRFIDEDKFDEDVADLASIGAHETVHRLIDDEIDQWAAEQSGVNDLNEVTELDLDDEDWWDNWSEQNLRDDNRKKLRSIAHEFGAYSLTPDFRDPSGFVSREKRKKLMSGPNYAGRKYSSGELPMSDLRPKSESMAPFDAAWAIVKMPYHMTDASNIESIMREGLKPLAYGLNASMEDAISEIEDNFDYTREEALAYLKQYADHFGFDSVEDLWYGNADWAFVAREYDPDELANYAHGHEKPVLLEVGQEEDFMPDYGYYSGHERTPKTVRPENINIEMEFPSRKESGLSNEQYERMIADMMREARS